MVKKTLNKLELNLLWLIFTGVFFVLILLNFYLLSFYIPINEESASFTAIALGEKPLLQPIIDVAKSINAIIYFTSLLSLVGFIAAFLTALSSFFLSGGKIISFSFIITIIILLAITTSFLIFFYPPDVEKFCVGCDEFHLEKSKMISSISEREGVAYTSNCLTNVCFLFQNQEFGIIREECGESVLIGRLNSKNELINLDKYKFNIGVDECMHCVGCDDFFYNLSSCPPHQCNVLPDGTKVRADSCEDSGKYLGFITPNSDVAIKRGRIVKSELECWSTFSSNLMPQIFT